MAVTVLPASAPFVLTATGAGLDQVVAVELLPSCPKALLPHVKTRPSEASATLWENPPEMALTILPESAPLVSTAVGLFLSMNVPSPTLLPQPKTPASAGSTRAATNIIVRHQT